jgi:hypothetical protein
MAIFNSYVSLPEGTVQKLSKNKIPEKKYGGENTIVFPMFSTVFNRHELGHSPSSGHVQIDFWAFGRLK